MPAATDLKSALSAANQAANAGHYDDAISRYLRLLNSHPNNPTILHYLGLAKFHQSDYTSAIDYIRKAIAATKKFDGELWKNMGVCYARLGNHDQARTCWLEILKIQPNDIDAQLLVAKSYATQLDFAKAKTHCEKILKNHPTHVETLFLLATIERSTNPDRTAEILKKIVSLQPNNLTALGLLQDTYARLLLIKESNDILRKMLELDERHSNVFSTYLLMLHYEENVDPAYIYARHKQWATRYKDSQRLNAITAAKPEKKLRVGVISGDFLFHPVMTFFFTLIDKRDPNSIGYFLYSETANPDTMTRDLRNRADRWRDVRGLGDEAIARKIVADKIDILIDVSGHTAHNRLGVFALRPAPIQLTYIGYPDTTGLTDIDYRLTDEMADPPGKTDKYHTEKLVRLPSTFLCYYSTIDAFLAPEPPSEKIGHIAFGCFNNYLKLSEHCLRLFSEVLAAVPNSVLVLKSSHIKNDNSNEIILSRLKALGVDEKRIAFFKHIPSKQQHLTFYNSIDIALDSYPYNGTTTTCEAFYMGVPVISRVGETHYTRVGASLLHSVGLDDLAAADDSAFVAAAKSLASDKSRLKSLKKTLRRTLTSSPLGNPKLFIPQYENCLRHLWREWCAQHLHSTPTVDSETENAIEGQNTPEFITLNIPNDIKLTLQNDIDNYLTFVILEQEDWYEDEIRFIRSWARKGYCAADIGSDHGIYALNLAKALSDDGKVLVFESKNEPYNLIETNVLLNRFNNARLYHFIPGEFDPMSESHSSLDTLIEQNDLQKMDFIRIGHVSDKLTSLKSIFSVFEKYSPLLMVTREIDSSFDRNIIDELAKIGFRCYRYIGSLNVLVPFGVNEELDYYSLNLFFAKDEQALLLKQEGRLVFNRLTTPIHIESSSDRWNTALATLPFAHDLIESWESRAKESSAPFWGDYERDLNLAISAIVHPEMSPDERLLRLETAFIGLSQGINQYANIPRMLTCIRVAMATGHRDVAMKLTSKAFQILSHNINVSVGEPFLPSHPRYDNLEMSVSQEKWIRACVTESVERYGYFTSYTTGCMPLSKLDYLPTLGITTPDLERRKTLIHYKEGLVDKIIPGVTFKTSGDYNLNLEFWKTVADGSVNIGRRNGR